MTILSSLSLFTNHYNSSQHVLQSWFFFFVCEPVLIDCAVFVQQLKTVSIDCEQCFGVGKMQSYRFSLHGAWFILCWTIYEWSSLNHCCWTIIAVYFSSSSCNPLLNPLCLFVCYTETYSSWSDPCCLPSTQTSCPSHPTSSQPKPLTWETQVPIPLHDLQHPKACDFSKHQLILFLL